MESSRIKLILINSLLFTNIFVEGYNKNFKIIAISVYFEGLKRIEREKMVYKPLIKYITNNEIHSVSIQTYTDKEWNEFCINEK